MYKLKSNNYLLLTTYYLLLITKHLPLTTNHLPITTNYHYPIISFAFCNAVAVNVSPLNILAMVSTLS
jgi:hypothetical protein